MTDMKKIFVAGHRGMVGSAVCRRLEKEGVKIVTASRSELDLCNQAQVRDFMQEHKPDAAFIAAAKVGGIGANSTYVAEFIYNNLMIASNCIHQAYEAGVKKLLFLGSTCIYPKMAPQPIPESALLSGPLEPTNEPYAVAKIAGLKLAQYYRQQYGVNYFSLMPTNLYGPKDNYDLFNSHVLPALIRKVHEAKKANKEEYVVWGTGSPLREFLHVDDLAEAVVFTMGLDNPPDLINVGSGSEISIGNLAKLVCDTVGFEGNLVFDTDKPDGTPRKLVDSSLLRSLGWKPKISLEEGLKSTCKCFLEELETGTLRGL